MKNKKCVLVLLAILLLLLPLIVEHLIPGRHPAEQPGTTWSTKNGSVVFSVEEDPVFGTVSSGYICTSKGCVDVSFVMSVLDGGVDVYTPQDYSMLTIGGVVYPIESWTAVSIKTDRLVVKVTNSTYFEKGQELVFFKVE